MQEKKMKQAVVEERIQKNKQVQEYKKKIKSEKIRLNNIGKNLKQERYHRKMENHHFRLKEKLEVEELRKEAMKE